MRRLRCVVFLLIVGVLPGAWASSGAWNDAVRPWLHRASAPAKSPTEAIKELDRMLSSYHTGANLTPEQQEENRVIKQKVIQGTFDLRELSRISLGRHWIELSDADRNHFVDLMTNLLEEKGVLSKEQGQKKAKSGAIYNITYRGDKFLDPIKRRALARTQVFVPSHNVRVALDYKLHRNGEWKIYDVIVDGSSLVENYQYQFDNIITKYGFPELIKRMEKKLAEIRATRGK